MDHFKVAILVPVAVTLAYALSSFYTAREFTQQWLSVAGLWFFSTPFIALFTFRYLRLVVHLFSFWFLYRPAPIPQHPTITARDCTVILPTIDPDNKDFQECLELCLRNKPAEILIVTVSHARSRVCNNVIAAHQRRHPQTSIRVLVGEVENKRCQVALAIPEVKTAITVLLDDHVFWPSAKFLPAAVAPFEDENVGAVGTKKRVRKEHTGVSLKSFFNMLGALYLERHNFEIRATNAIDGGVFVVSGRTALYRTKILQDPDFLYAYVNEKFFFGLFGPLNADDDNCLTRWVVNHGWSIRIQYSEDAMIETTLGHSGKFHAQCLRWVRTTWRSNTTSLLADRTVWTSQPWCVYAVYLTSYVSFALFYDAALICTLIKAPFGSEKAMYILLTWIGFSKMIKLTPYFFRHPADLIMLPGYFVWAYYHSLLKLYAGLTFWNTEWSGRCLGKHDGPAVLNHNGLPNDNKTNDDDAYDDGAADDDQSSTSDDNGWASVTPGQGTNPYQTPRGTIKGLIHPITTPWGDVIPSNTHKTPANVLESQWTPTSHPQKPSFHGTKSHDLPSARTKSSPRQQSSPIHPTPISMTSEKFRSTVSVGSHVSSRHSSRDYNLYSADKPDSHSSYSTYSLSRQDSEASQRYSDASIDSAVSSEVGSLDNYKALDSPVDYSVIVPAPFTPTASPPPAVETGDSPPDYGYPTPTATPTGAPAREVLYTAPTSRSRKPSSYRRLWVRGQYCERLHYDACKLSGRGACHVESVWTLGDSVIPSHPRS